MNSAAKFLSEFLSSLNISLGCAILFFACIIKLVTFIMTHHEIKALQIAEIIRPERDEIFKKYKDDPQSRAKEVLMLLKNYGCKIFFGIDNILLQSFITACLIYIFTHQQYLPAIDPASMRFLWINDLSSSPMELIIQPEGSSIFSLIGSLIFPAASAIIYFYLARYITRKSVFKRENQQKCILAAIIAVGVFSAQAVSLYLFALLSLTVLQYFITIKFFPLKTENYQK